MRLAVVWMTFGAFALHLLLGCCFHHAHAHNFGAADFCGPTQTCPGHHHDHGVDDDHECHHDEPEAAADEPSGDDISRDDGHDGHPRPSGCDHAPCVYVTPPAVEMPLHDGPAVVSWLTDVVADRLAMCRLVRGEGRSDPAEFCHGPVMRTHLLLGVLLL